MTRTICDHRLVLPEGIQNLRTSLIDVQPIRLSPDELPALAFGSHYSVFKERPGTHQSSRCWCRVCQRTAPDDAGESPSAAGGPWGPFRRECHCSRRVTERQRAFQGREPPGVTRAATSFTDRSGTSAVADGCPPERPGSLQAQASRRHQWWHAGGHPAFRMPPGARCATGFPLPSLPPIQGVGGVHCLLMPSNYRMSPRCDECMMNRRCCRVVTGR